ncbi:MAG: hypothetical protein VKK59_07580 [Vampirovibrionales bacterium]|nr:hypothetical protein [Vampirovibrionales bacterium]
MLSAYSPFLGPPIRRATLANNLPKSGNANLPGEVETAGIQPGASLPKSQASSTASETSLSSGQTNPQSRQKLSLGGIIQDFRRTMAALGTQDDTKEAVENYLNVTILESQKENPSIGLIKGLLKSASDRLDGAIGKTLNQPSHVVREWMDAVLLQEVNFKESDIKNAPLKSSLHQASALMESAQHALATGEPEAATSAWRKLIAVAEASLSSREAENALSTFKNATEVAKQLNQPDILKASLSGMVKAYLDLNQHDMALKVLQVADRLKPSNP